MEHKWNSRTVRKDGGSTTVFSGCAAKIMIFKKTKNDRNSGTKATETHPHRPVLQRLMCFLLLFCMLPVFKIDSGAAENLEYQYVWLISKPAFRYSYDEDGAWVLNTNTDSGVRMQKQGDYYISTGFIPVETDYSNRTIPQVPDWDGTPFEYTGRAEPFSYDLIAGDNYIWAGNISGGEYCSVSKDPTGYVAGHTSSYAVQAPASFKSGGTTYYIRPQLEEGEMKYGTRIQTGNVTCFLFKSTKPLPSIGGGGSDPDPEPVSDVTADLSVSGDSVTANYKDFDVNGRVTATVTLDPSDSESALGWDSYRLQGYNSAGTWDLDETYDGTPRRQSYIISYGKDDIGFNGYPGTATDRVYGEVSVTDGETSDTAEDDARITLEFTNDDPVASISSIVSENIADTSYGSTFYYAGENIRVTDGSYDPEDRKHPSQTDNPELQYSIQYEGSTVLTCDFNELEKIDELFDNAVFSDNSLSFAVKEPGYYTIRAWIQDEIGVTDVATKTIYVAEPPAPPTAIINSGNYTFVNYPLTVKDGSTDPNDDIVTWVWGDVMTTGEDGTQIPATGVSDGLKDATYPPNGSKPTNIGGSLTFQQPGEYTFGLTVTDATGQSDSTEQTVKVIRDIPVAEIVPGPENPTNPSDSDPHYEVDSEDGLEKIYVKQNRKVVLDASSSLSPPASPIVWESTEWEYDASETDPDFDLDTVKIDGSSSVQRQVFLAKECGEFKVTITLHNAYSDALPADDPDIVARTKTVIVKVLPDEDPLSTIQVDNANPNFHDNPVSVDVDIVATGKSVDNDLIDYYNWKLYRDNNDDNEYTDSELLTQMDKTQTSQVTVPVRFESGNTSTFRASVDVYEKFGQETIQEFITPEDIRYSSSQMDFEVNWRPCISYTMRDFAYVDDTLTISPVLKDENVETCSVEWTLMRKNAEGEYEAIAASDLPANVFGDAPIWELGLHGGTIRITQDGYYRLDSVITDAEGHSEYFTSTEIRIYDVPRAVISDDSQYRWEEDAFQFKESRKFTLNGNASYVDDATGVALHQLNRSQDEWSITPLDGQDAGNIYVATTADGTQRLDSLESNRFYVGKNAFDETLAILEPGRYQIEYRVTNTYGKRSPVTTQEIVIAEDTAPIIEGVIADTIERGSEEDGASTTISITDLNIYSDDYDIINTNWTVEMQYDTGNDGFQNDQWMTVAPEYIDISYDDEYQVIMNIAIPEDSIGKYEFCVYARDEFGQETLPIVPDSERKESSKLFETEVDNVKPNGTFSTRAEAKGDVVFAIGDSAVSKEVQNASLSFGNRFGAESGTNTLDVRVETVETSSVDLTNAFKWKQDVNSAIGSLSLDATGQNVQMFGNRTNAGKNAIWIASAEKGEQIFQFDYSIDFGDSFNGAGMYVNLAERQSGSSTYLDAYGISFNNSGPFPRSANGSVWKMTYKVGENTNQNFTSMTKVADLNIASSGTLTVTVDGTKLKISGGGMTERTIEMDEIGTGFGFFSSHYSHSCNNIGEFSLRNITMQVTKRKNLNDALSDVAWRDGAERFVIYVDDLIWDYMSPNMDAEDPNSYAELLSSLLDSNIHLIALGSDTNKAQLTALLSQLNEEGLYYKNNPSATAMDQAEAFIREILRQEAQDTMYVLVNERLDYNKIYRDYNGDPQWIWTADGNTPYIAEDDSAYAAHFQAFQDNPSILAQKWEYFHDEDYYDNSLGLASFDQEWIAHEVNVFNKVGRYEVDYRIKDNPVPDKTDNSTGNPFHEYRYWSSDYAADETDSSGNITNPHAVIYVHRRPLAEFDFVAHKINDVVDEIDITNNAYDLDHQYSDADKGLNLYEWKWKFANDSSWRGEATFTDASEAEQWINDQLVGLRSLGMDNIIVQYRVRDIDGMAESETVDVTHKTDSGWATSSETAVRNIGEWSLPTVRWITNKGLPPIARFDTNNTIFGLGDEITVSDRSYSPNGDNIVKWEWTIERANGAKTSVTYTLGSGGINSVEAMENAFSTFLTNWIDNQPVGSNTDDDSYRITLIVTDDKPQPMTSDPYTVTVTIEPENTAPTIDPNTPESGSIFSNDNPTVYEYDDYDANLVNPYYTYKGAAQLRGSETLDWSVVLDDPDNHDKYGTGNDSGSYKLQFMLDRFLEPFRSLVADEASGTQRINYPVKNVTSAQALISSNIAPFNTVKDAGLGWGAWRITATVTDVPNNGTTPKSTDMVTYGYQKPFHLYVIPKLDLDNVHFTFDGVLDNQVQIPTGEIVTITATTNDRSTGAKILYKDGDGVAFEQEMTLDRTEGETSYWTAEFVIPDNLEAEDLISGEYYPYQIETYTNYGSTNGEVTRTKVKDCTANIHILPIKLYDFTITGITDPTVEMDGPASVPDLAYDRNNSTNGALMKLGYAFNFELYSKGMKDDDDYIRIRPSFYGYNIATGRYDMPLDVYYLNENGEYVLATTDPDGNAASGDDYVLRTEEFIGREIGSIRELELNSSFRENVDRNTQKWSARYGLPGTAVFVAKGEPLTETSLYLGDVLINFDIEAMKHGSPKYNYVGKGQWTLERTNGGTLLNPQKAIYNDGDVIVLDGANDATLDYESRPVWTKLK